MTRLLITGAGGFVGSHLIERALQVTNWDVVAIDSFRHNGITDRIVDATGNSDRVTVVPHDLSVPISELAAQQIGPVDHIIDAASGCSVDESIREPGRFVMNNYAVTVNVLEFMRVHARRATLIHVSTDEVYGPGQPTSASDHRPSSPYAASKAAQEDLCHAYHHTFGLRIGVFSSSNMFGERQSTLAFIPKLIRATLTGEEIGVREPGSRRYTYVKNTAAALIALLTSPELNYDDVPMPRSQLPGQQLVANRDLASQVADLAEKPLRVKTAPAETDRPGHDSCYAPLSHGALTPDWAYTFEEGLSRTVQWGIANPEWVLT